MVVLAVLLNLTAGGCLSDQKCLRWARHMLLAVESAANNFYFFYCWSYCLRSTPADLPTRSGKPPSGPHKPPRPPGTIVDYIV